MGECQRELVLKSGNRLRDLVINIPDYGIIPVWLVECGSIQIDEGPPAAEASRVTSTRSPCGSMTQNPRLLFKSWRPIGLHLTTGSFFDSSDNLVEVCRPYKGSKVGILIGDEAIDGGLKADDGMHAAAFEQSLGQLGEEAFGSVKPGTGRWDKAGVTVELSADLGMFVGGKIVEDDVHRLSLGTLVLRVFKKRMDAWCRCCSMLRPITVPSRTLTTANGVAVPLRL